MTWVFKVLCPVLIKNLLIIYTFELLHVVLLMLRDTLFHLPTNVQSTSALKHFYESRGAGSTPSGASCVRSERMLNDTCNGTKFIGSCVESQSRVVQYG